MGQEIMFAFEGNLSSRLHVSMQSNYVQVLQTFFIATGCKKCSNCLIVYVFPKLAASSAPAVDLLGASSFTSETTTDR